MYAEEEKMNVKDIFEKKLYYLLGFIATTFFIKDK